MSKALVQKALLLLQDDVKQEKSKRGKNKDSSLKSIKSKKHIKEQMQSYQQKNEMFKEIYAGLLKNSSSVDKTEKNLKVLNQLRRLKPKTSVAQKVVEFYSKRKNYSEEPVETNEPKSILFDDDDDDKQKKKKRKM